MGVMSMGETPRRSDREARADQFGDAIAQELKIIVRRIVAATDLELSFVTEHLMRIEREEWERHTPDGSRGNVEVNRYLSKMNRVFSSVYNAAEGSK
jgi:hypothetical protein